jgi:PIN domain-containing protein
VGRGAPPRYDRIVSSIIYLDVCCLKRPFDDRRATRVQLETAAGAALIERAERGELRLVRSPAHTFENDRNPREDRRLATASWLNGARVEAALTESAAARARELGGLGFSPLDALHTAFAEEAGAALLATTDDGLIALGQRHREKLRVSITNPTHLLQRLAGGEP